MKNSAYTVHLELATLPVSVGNRWETTPQTIQQRLVERKADLAAANRVKGRMAKGFCQQAAMKALNNLKRMGV